MFVYQREEDKRYYSMWGWVKDPRQAAQYRTVEDATASTPAVPGAAVKAPAPVDPTVDVQNGAAAIFGYGKRP